MLKKIIHKLILRRHYWRHVEFDELAELYTTMISRSLAVSIIGIFIPIYLFQLGFGISSILLFYAGAYLTSQIFSIFASYFVARYGPKHAMFVSQFLMLAAMSMLLTLGSIGWPLAAVAVFFGAANTFYYLAFHVDFSKVKHIDHCGKEVGWLFFMQRVGVAVGPILGGFVAYFIGAQYIFIVAMILMFLGALSLFYTSEPTKTKQKISFSKLNLGDIKSDLLSYGAFGIEQSVSMVIWPFFLALIVFADDPYRNLGIVTSVSVIVALLATRFIGTVIDEKKGRSVLRAGIILNAALHLFRPFVKSFSTALAVNFANEIITPMYRLPFVKGMYSAADDHPGNRIVYMGIMEIVCSFARFLFFVLAAILSLFMEPYSLFVALFVVGAVSSLVIGREKFKALN